MNNKFLHIWIIWFALLQGMLIVIFYLGGGIPSFNFTAPETSDIFHFIPFIPLVIALIARVAILPKIPSTNYQAILVITIAGIALCEGAIIISLLLNKGYYHLYNSSSILAGIIIAVAYIPLYLNKKSQDKSFYQIQK